MRRGLSELFEYREFQSTGHRWVTDLPVTLKLERTEGRCRVLLNMYTYQQIRVLWNGEKRRETERYCQPLLFCVYVDDLLTELEKAGLGCFPSLAIGGYVIENIDRWPHLGHVFNAHLTDDDDILARRNSFIGQANIFFGNFPMLDTETKNSLVRHTVAVNMLKHFFQVFYEIFGRINILIYSCETLQIIISRIIALHGGIAFKDYGRLH